MRTFLVALITITFYASCKETGSGVQHTSIPEGISFIEKSYMDTTVRPGDDFFRYAGGAWLKNNPVPATETRWGAFDLLGEHNKKILKELVEEAAENPGTKNQPAQMVGDLFASGMDSVSRDKAGIQPIQDDLNEIRNLKDNSELETYLVGQTKEGMNPLFGFYVSPDEKNVTKYVCGLWQGGLGLPDRGYYIKNEEREKNIRKEYVKHIQKIFELIHETPEAAKKMAQTVMNLETKLAQASMDRTEMRDPYKTYNKRAVGQLESNRKAAMDNFSWVKYFKDLGIKDDTLIVGQPEFVRSLTEMLADVSIEDWKVYLTWHTLKDWSKFLSTGFVNENFKFYGTVLSGQKEQKPRWKDVLGVVDGAVGEQLGKLYTEKYFTSEAKERMKELVNNLQMTFGERIDKLEWMSDSTKNKAKEKLNAFVKKIGYPDKWKDYSGLEITRDSYVKNIKTSNIFDYNFMVNKLGKEVDKTEWGMSPQTVNAYYNPSFNEIVFPAGILQYPFFDLNADDAVLYGAIGAVIGHEMTHGFDDQGSQYAADGNLKNWWSAEDKAQFDAKTKMVEKQFDGYSILNNKHVNGKLTLGENIADLGGVTIAYEAFKKTKQGQSGEKIDGFNPDQRFFLSWAQVWRGNIVDEEAAKRLVTDPHSPGVFRCNGPLSNFDPFYTAFNVSEGDQMWKPKTERAVIW